MTYQCTEDLFLKDVADHQMEIIKNDGVYRHIRFKQPGTMSDHFDLISWPGCLCYTGDMGTFVFSRLNDMFEFFRTGGYRVNLSYWAEKLLGDSPNKGHKEFDEDEFRKVINRYRINWVRQMKQDEVPAQERRDLWEAVECQVLDEIDNFAERAKIAAYDFCHRSKDREYSFEDLWEHNFERYTFHFIWCCHALAWGIEQYDKAMQSQEQTA